MNMSSSATKKPIIEFTENLHFNGAPVGLEMNSYDNNNFNSGISQIASDYDFLQRLIGNHSMNSNITTNFPGSFNSTNYIYCDSSEQTRPYGYFPPNSIPSEVDYSLEYGLNNIRSWNNNHSYNSDYNNQMDRSEEYSLSFNPQETSSGSQSTSSESPEQRRNLISNFINPAEFPTKLDLINSSNNQFTYNNSYQENSSTIIPEYPLFQEHQMSLQTSLNITSNRDVQSPVINTISNQPESGELEAFAEKFKQRRIKLGVTQADVGRALGKMKISGVGSLSQSTICRFESLTLSHNNMIALKPILQTWLEEAESQSTQTFDDPLLINTPLCNFESPRQGTILIDSPPMENPASFSNFKSVPQIEQISLTEENQYNIEGNSDMASNGTSWSSSSADRKRKRTSITDNEKRSLEAFFSVQPRPSSEKIGQIADKLNLKKNVVRVWFCNQRQKQKRMKFKQMQLLQQRGQFE